MPQVQHHFVVGAGQGQGLAHQQDHFQVAVAAGVAEQLDAELVGQPGTAHLGGPGAQRRGAVTQTGGGVAAQAVGVDARHLRGHVRAHAHQAPAELVGDLEGVPLQVTAGAVEQGLQEFDQRRVHQLVAPGLVQVQSPAAQLFDGPGAFGKHFLDAVGQQPLFFLIHLTIPRVFNRHRGPTEGRQRWRPQKNRAS